ncbi:MAG: hypothetical protein A7315_04915 [Candidatus Altiarchaeales archaeon WOR_SM1_79]|nr:MAG: hypothetical protein A7315_04915 [Candidatus Altiarchaeales archaeon WOR_SM1_79]
MGNVGLKIEAVSNSGPLIHLAQIGMFHLLDIFPVIYLFVTRALVDIAIDEIRNIEKRNQ